MSAFLNLRSPSGPLDSFSPEVLLSLQELPEFACLDVEELRNLPGLEARHTLGSLGEMLEELSVLPASQQTDHHQQVLRLNPSLQAALTDMKGHGGGTLAPALWTVTRWASPGPAHSSWPQSTGLRSI